MSTVLVTGGSGFIGSHSILQLLAAGHRVRTTVRSLKREADVRATLAPNLCRCGTHNRIIRAVMRAAQANGRI